jgi:hypothetical protein
MHGQHYRISGIYLPFYAGEIAWREDMRVSGMWVSIEKEKGPIRFVVGQQLRRADRRASLCRFTTLAQLGDDLLTAVLLPAGHRTVLLVSRSRNTG